MLSEQWGYYTYSTSQTRAGIAWGALTSEVRLYLCSRPLEPFVIKTAPSGDVLFSGDVPVGAASLEALFSQVDERLARTKSEPRHPASILFPALDSGESVLEATREVLLAAESLASLLIATWDSIEIVYGYINPLMLPHFPEPQWGGHLSGLRFADDPHFYSLQAELGRLDLIQHDPVTNQPLKRTDIRTWDEIPSVIGAIKICRQQVDVAPFLQEIRGVIESLRDGGDEMMTIRWHESAGD